MANQYRARLHGNGARSKQFGIESMGDSWPTPWPLFNAIDEALGPFSLDVCATEENRKCDDYFDEATNGLIQPWGADGDWTWCNPPYSRGQLDKWIGKAQDERECGIANVMLTRNETSARWFYEAHQIDASIIFLVGNVAFGGMVSAAPFGSALLVFDPYAEDRIIDFWDWKKGQPLSDVIRRGHAEG